MCNVAVTLCGTAGHRSDFGGGRLFKEGLLNDVKS